MKLPLLAVVALASPACASWTRNINYRSPSEHHPALGISIRKVVKRNDLQSSWDPAGLNFTHGVASGDPYPESVILWTRVGPDVDNDRSNATVSGYVPLFDHDNQKYVAVSKAPVCVEFKIAADEGLENVADSGRVFTSSDVDYTVKVEAKNLKPFTTYYYQFNVCNSNNKSPIGRTKTTPDADDDISKVSLAVYSCANYPFGFFNAYGNSARKDSVDYVVHLGDYIYEYGEGEYGWGYSIGRITAPNKQIYTLYDYRRRLASYRADSDLALSHQQYAWIATWDDHEVADNVFRDGTSEMNNTEQTFVSDGGISFDQRKANAVRAYFEWMPIRQVEMDDNLRIWRSFRIGRLADLIMLDTRNYDRSITDLYWNTDYIQTIRDDTGRSMMGARQENWFYNSLSASAARGATWRLVGNQVLFSRIDKTAVNENKAHPFNLDTWDGYMANKNRTLNHLYSNRIGNNVFLAGDSHANWVSDLVWPDVKPYDPVTGIGAIGVELGGTAVTSPTPFGENITLADARNRSTLLQTTNPHLQWQETYYRGYFELHVSKEEVRAEFFGLPTILERRAWEIPVANFSIVAGENRVKRPVGGGRVESGSLMGGRTVETNVTFDTEEGTWFVGGKKG